MQLPLQITSLLLGCFICLASFSQKRDTLSIYFDFNSAEMTNRSSERIDSFLYSKKNLSITKINLRGYCDKIGSNKYNDRLAAKRIATTKQYLLNMGFETLVISSMIAYGERKPINKNLTEQERLLNRRVELIIEAIPFNQLQQKSISKQLTDTSVKVGSTLVLKNLNFYPNRHFLVNESLPVLDELLGVLKQNPNLKIEIQGHVCCTSGPDALDIDMNLQNLSIQRARFIYNYLIENGIAASRLSYRGFGSSQKLYPEEKNEFERLQNRRVEIKIISK